MSREIEWTDEDIVSYFELHAKTERALFHRSHVERLFQIAHLPVPSIGADFIPCHWDKYRLIIERARRALKMKVVR